MALSRTATIALNTFTNYARFGISIIVWFFLTPYIILKVGSSDFGLWALTFSVIGFFGLMDFGFGTGVVKYVAECKGSGDTERRNRMLSTFAAVYLLLALIAVAAVYLLSIYYNDWFSIAEVDKKKADTLLWIIAARSVFLGLPLALFRAILFGEQKIYMINAVQAGTTIIYGIASWFALKNGMGIVTLAWLNLLAMLLEHALYIILSFIYVPQLQIHPRQADKLFFKEAASFSVYTFLINVSALILLRTDPIIIKLFLPLSSVAVYAVALKVAENAHLFTKQFVNVLTPLVAELKGQGDNQKIRFVLVNCTRFALAPAIMIFVVTIVYAREGLLFWIGPEFTSGAPVLIILMLAFTILIPQMTASVVLTMTGLHKVTGRASVLSMAINIVLSLILIIPFGLIGVALATLASTIVIDIFVVVRIACKEYKIKLADYAYRAVITAFLPGILQAGLTIAIKLAYPPENLTMIALQVFPGLLIYLLIFWRFYVEPSEKQLLTEKLWKKKKV